MRPTLLWFRSDLRLHDNPALAWAAEDARPVAALYVLDEDSHGIRAMGGAARWWLAGSLRALAADLAARNIPLLLRTGRAADLVPALARDIGAERLAFNSRPGAAEARVDTAVAAALEDDGITVKRFNGHLLYKPGSIRTMAGGLPRTFSAFQRASRKAAEPRRPLPVPPSLTGVGTLPSDDVEAWITAQGLEPTAPDWAGGMRAAWTCGEAGGRKRLADFITDGLEGYAEGRDRPDAEHVSRLSPYLASGALSPNQVLYAIRGAAEAGEAPHGDAEKFEAELLWREFSHHLLEAEPDLRVRNLQPRFDAFPWREASGELKAWRKGLTGYPLVDAGLRQLWQTGWMHNRVRMVVASFLAKHLLIDWREGEAWFWDTLVDADPANNPASWQWVAGTGADAAPYFRVFNPVLQGEKFDPAGEYVRAFVPELARLPNSLIHKPWAADAAALARAGVRLGITYPRPLVDHDAARARALRAFEHIRGN
ncbi:cryptochrome/photolyase family protein [Aquabacter cavernae]|uniref:cryptochrome/photolyase family protein n=1 Tax=Aquabacter cavernae TaxID=2496029 RepID=UPI000F8EDBE4|nr:deoxyribodipyrimidine photo-lyase [Aquabacter cavernae]